MAERNLSIESIKAVINSSSQKRFLRNGDNGGQTLVAIAEIRHGECWIITGYYA